MEQKTSKCPNCVKYDNRGVGRETGWRPPQGIHPRMREFKCSHCGWIFYKITHERLERQPTSRPHSQDRDETGL